jgi:GTPase
MLIDRVKIEVRSGKGGDGCISFLQEKNMPKGGPDGGNGGKGGSVFLLAKANINTLLAYRHSRLLEASDGGKGDKKLRNGKAAADKTFEVPVGTLVSEEDGTVIADLNKEGMSVCVAKGGRGGKGNACFKSSRLRIPRIAENGHPGERKRLILELKLLADAGLVGFPSVGKSTFLNIVSKANVATADYPFTTLVPNLGVVTVQGGYDQFVLADMPGLIEGAHLGKGKGIEFLRHIERCRVLVHMVSMSGERDPYEDYQIVNAELKEYGAELEKRPMIVVATKMDEDGALTRKKEFDAKLGFASIGISALTNEGVNPLINKIYELVEKTPAFSLFKEGKDSPSYRVYDAEKEGKEPPFVISHPSDHLFLITGKEVLEQYALMNLSDDQGVARLISYLGKIGVEKELEKKGAKDGDTVRLADFEFTYTR